MAHHGGCAWFDTLAGKYRVILDTTSAHGAGEGLQYSANVYNANRTGYQLENGDIALVLCLRHFATIFAFNNAMWAKYDKQLAEAGEFTDPKATAPPKTNPHNSSDRPPLDNLAKRGAHFAVCGLATPCFAGLIAGEGGDTDAVFKKLSAGNNDCGTAAQAAASCGSSRTALTAR